MFSFFKKEVSELDKLNIAIFDFENFTDLRPAENPNFNIVKLFIGANQNKITLPSSTNGRFFEFLKSDVVAKNNIDSIIAVECGKYFEKYKNDKANLSITIFSFDNGYDGFIADYNYQGYSIKRVGKEFVELEHKASEINSIRADKANKLYSFMLTEKFKKTPIRKHKNTRLLKELANYINSKLRNFNGEELAKYILEEHALKVEKEIGGKPVDVNEEALKRAFDRYKQNIKE